MNRCGISTDIKNRIKMLENCELITKSDSETPDSQNFVSHSTGNTDEPEDGCQGPATTMMMPTPPPPPPPGVQTDANGLILPKKLVNPCLYSTDRKQLHRELKFNTKMGISVLNQKTELQKAYEKQREKHQHQQDSNQQQTQHSPTFGLKSELNRVIMERAQKYERARLQSESENDNDKQYVNPEYLNARAKLRAGQRTDLK